MAKSLSSFGLLMELLHIPIQQLAQHLYIDRTTISKWRSGARKLNDRSPYFEKMTRLFAEKNESLGHPLRRLFSDVYPDARYESTNDIVTLIGRYLNDDKSSILIGQYVEEMHKALYQTDVSIFRGPIGRKNAINMLFSVAEASVTPCQIKIFELDQFEWLNRDMAFVQVFLTKIKALVNAGHTFELSYSTTKTAANGNAAFRTFIRSFSSLYFHKSIKINLLENDGHISVIPSLYGIVGKCMAVGISHEDNINRIYTSFFTDEFTVEKYMLIHDKMVALHTHPFLVTDEDAEKDRILELMRYTRTKHEPAYYYGIAPSIATMSESLLDEILTQNRLSASDRARCLTLYETLKFVLTDSPADSFGGLYLDMSKIIDSVTYDSLIQYELSAFSQKTVLMTREQQLRHLADTADFIGRHNHIKMYAVQGSYYDATVGCNWIKRNLWCCAMNALSISDENRIFFIDDAPLVNLSADLCEEMLNQYPLQYKNADYISEIFGRLSRGEQV